MSGGAPDGMVVGVDGSAAALHAVKWAAFDAALRRTRLTLVNVCQPLPGASWPGLPAEYWSAMENQRIKILCAAVAAAESTPGRRRASAIETEVCEGHPVRALTETSEHAEMVVVGCRGTSLYDRVLMGSVSRGVLHHARCPVAVVHADNDSQQIVSQAPVVVGIDGSSASERATAIAFDEASRRGVGLTVVHSWIDYDHSMVTTGKWRHRLERGRVDLSERLAGWQELYPDVTVERQLDWGPPTALLLAAAETAQLVVVGSHGRGGFTGKLLGSVSMAVAQSARVPVIVARGR